MKHKRLQLSALLLLVLGLTGLQAQESVNASGGEAFGTGGSASYSVGQVFYRSNTGTNGSVTQGMQQPFEISIVTGLEEAQVINLSVSAYPNPTTDYLILKVENYSNLSLSYLLFNMDGKLLENKKISGFETSIVMGNYIPSTYFLKVKANNKEVKIFKIIKN